jgi:hypothetical protein
MSEPVQAAKDRRIIHYSIKKTYFKMERGLFPYLFLSASGID